MLVLQIICYVYFSVELYWAKATWQERRASCRVLNSRLRFECQRNSGVSRWPWETEDYMRTLSLKVTKQTIISLPKILHQPPINYVLHINRCLTNVGVNKKLFICTASIRCQPVCHFLMIDNGISWELSWNKHRKCWKDISRGISSVHSYFYLCDRHSNNLDMIL